MHACLFASEIVYLGRYVSTYLGCQDFALGQLGRRDSGLCFKVSDGEICEMWDVGCEEGSYSEKVLSVVDLSAEVTARESQHCADSRESFIFRCEQVVLLFLCFPPRLCHLIR